MKKKRMLTIEERWDCPSCGLHFIRRGIRTCPRMCIHCGYEEPGSLPTENEMAEKTDAKKKTTKKAAAKKTEPKKTKKAAVAKKKPSKRTDVEAGIWADNMGGQIKRLIMEGKKTDAQIWAWVAKKYPQDCGTEQPMWKAGYVAWARHNLKSKGFNPPARIGKGIKVPKKDV